MDIRLFKIYVNLCELCKTHACTKYLVIFIYTFRFISNFIDIIMIAEYHYDANEISKCFI